MLTRKRQAIRNAIAKKEAKILELQKEIQQLVWRDYEFSDRDQKYIEDENDVIVSHRPKVTEIEKRGLIQWRENFPCQDTGEDCWIERHSIVKVNGKWIDDELNYLDPSNHAKQ